jgi:hypothetical protein
MGHGRQRLPVRRIEASDHQGDHRSIIDSPERAAADRAKGAA